MLLGLYQHVYVSRCTQTECTSHTQYINNVETKTILISGQTHFANNAKLLTNFVSVCMCAMCSVKLGMEMAKV